MFNSCSPLYPGYVTTEDVNGKCFDTATLPAGERTIYSDQEYAVYIGENPDEDYVVLRNVKIQDGHNRWVKKKADRNCLSVDPNDCLIWCLVEAPALYKEVYLVTDMDKNSDFRYQRVSVVQPVNSRTAKVEVICDIDISQKLISEIVSTLNHNLKTIDKDHQELDDTFFAVLEEFQRKYNLPVGTLDLKTLEFMNLL